ncbi:MAG: glycosyltransferase family 2 protein [Polyangiaceae bacterium]
MVPSSRMWGESRIVVVVPARDEAPRIGRVVRSMPAFVDRIVVVDDGSRDDTANATLVCADPRVTLVRHERSRGVGASIAHGYAVALDEPGRPTDTFAVMAGDGQMDPRDLANVVLPVATGRADYVKGTRFRSRETVRVMPRARFVVGHVLSALTGFAVGRTISDSQCGFTALSRSLAERLPLASLWSGFGYPNDLIARVVESGGRLEEVDVRAIYADEVSRLRATHVPRIGMIVARAYVRRLKAERGRVRQPDLRAIRSNAS